MSPKTDDTESRLSFEALEVLLSLLFLLVLMCDLYTWPDREPDKGKG